MQFIEHLKFVLFILSFFHVTMRQIEIELVQLEYLFSK